MIRMCENGTSVAVELQGADDSGGVPEIKPLVGLALRVLRPCVAHDRQQSSLWLRSTL